MSKKRRHSLHRSRGSTLLNNIISYWKLDDLAGNAIDSASANDGTVFGATQGVAGKIGTAYSFDGLNDYVNIDPLVAGVATNTIGAWSIWAKPSLGSVDRIFSIADTSANEFVILSMNATGTISGQLRTVVENKWAFTTDNIVLTDGVFSHIVLNMDGVEPNLYVDNVDVPITFAISTDKTAWIVDLTGADNARMATFRRNGLADADFYDGVLDEIGVWSRNLTISEIAELWNGGAGLTYPF